MPFYIDGWIEAFDNDYTENFQAINLIQRTRKYTANTDNVTISIVIIITIRSFHCASASLQLPSLIYQSSFFLSKVHCFHPFSPCSFFFILSPFLLCLSISRVFSPPLLLAFSHTTPPLPPSSGVSSFLFLLQNFFSPLSSPLSWSLSLCSIPPSP